MNGIQHGLITVNLMYFMFQLSKNPYLLGCE